MWPFASAFFDLPSGIKSWFICKVQTQQKQKILRRGGKNTQKNYTTKYFCDPDNHDGVITHLEPDTLECKSQVGLRKHHYEQR